MICYRKWLWFYIIIFKHITHNSKCCFNFESLFFKEIHFYVFEQIIYFENKLKKIDQVAKCFKSICNYCFVMEQCSVADYREFFNPLDQITQPPIVCVWTKEPQLNA